MQFLWMALFALAITGADQLVKYLIVANIPLHGDAPLIPGIIKLTYVQNRGAAFSMLEGMQWLFVVIFVILTALLIFEYFKKPMPFTKLERWCIAAIYGGGLGNVIDRLFLGYVVDMFQTEFINFAIFNVADIFITCGCIFLMIHLAFFNKEFWKEEKK